MAYIRRGTTPYIEIFGDPTKLSALWITISQNSVVKIDKSLEDLVIEGDHLYVHLSQEDTLNLKGKALALVQVRALFSDDEATATDEQIIYIKDVEKDGVITVHVQER